MTPELWQRLKPLYEAALECPVESRSRFVVKACAGQPELRRELEALLVSADEPTGSFDLPIFNFDDLEASCPPAFSPGDSLLNRFRVVRLLGSGGMGEVYEVEDGHLQGVHIALKTIRPGIAANPDLRKRFEREVLLAREVVHPNLCPMYDIFHSEQPPPGLLFLTMKLLPGETLAARLKQDAPVTKEEGIAILNDVSLGVAAIHAAGIVHRDIKTNNIMLNGAGPNLHLWITDFGLARAFQTDTTVSTRTVLAGTPGYLAPELSLGAPPSQATDLFALGVVLHEVFFGEKPKASRDNLNVVVNPRLAALNLPPYAASLITDCLSSDPSRRCQAFDESLKVIDPHRNIHPPGPRPWTRRRFAAASLTGIALAGAATWWKREEVDAFVEDALHPLPQKRFVALLNWPRTTDAKVAPILTAVLSAIKSELARMESIDHNLLVIAPEDNNLAGPDDGHLQETCDSLGANLVFAASAVPLKESLKLNLQVLDPTSGKPLRSQSLQCALTGMTAAPEEAVHAAARLLNVPRTAPNDPKPSSGTHSPEAFALFQSAEALKKKPNDDGLDEAIRKYIQAVDQDPKYALAYGKLALAYCRFASIHHDTGSLELARNNARLALSLNPNLVEGHMANASVHIQSGDVPKALDEIKKALAIAPTNPESLVWQAQYYNRLNRWADAEALYKRILNSRPNFWLAYNEWGVALNAQGHYAEALEKFKAASSVAPRDALSLNNVGSINLQTGNYSEALTFFRRSYAIKATSLAALNLSMTFRALGKPLEAIPFALKAVELDPADDGNLLELADCYSAIPASRKEAKEAFAKAARAAEQHLRVDPTDGVVWMQLALYRVKTGNPQSTLQTIKKAEAFGALDIDSQLCKARIFELLGERDKAIETLKSCLSRGATTFQISCVTDLQNLIRDPKYTEIVRGGSITSISAS
jgi:serine/threonine protein kinase/tetratricopeptide (TPR) repeat protein